MKRNNQTVQETEHYIQDYCIYKSLQLSLEGKNIVFYALVKIKLLSFLAFHKVFFIRLVKKNKQNTTFKCFFIALLSICICRFQLQYISLKVIYSN